MNAARSALLPQKLLRSNLTSNNPLVRTFKSDLKIKWVRPEKIPCYKPEKSGDLSTMPSIDQTLYQKAFRQSKELEDASDLVKKLFSLEFAPRKESARVYFEELVNKTKRHPFDVASIDVKLAKWTGVIRAWQDVMDRFPRNKKMKVQLKELIDKRKKHLKYLRRWDYKRFEWIIETLNIVYKPPPNEFRWVARKESLVKLTNKYCDGIRDDRLNAYRLVLEQEQPVFLQEKIRALEFIRNEQIDCAVEVTVSEEEIAQVRKQLEDLIEERKISDKE